MQLVKWRNDVPSIISDFLGGLDRHRIFDDLLFPNFFTATVPLVNVKEDEKEYTLEVLAPKMSAEDLKIEVEDDKLHLSIKEEMHTESEDHIRQEYKLSYSDRTFRLPQDADAESITAGTDKGVIVIHIPKKEAQKPKRKLIEIQ